MAKKHNPDLFEPGHLAVVVKGGEYRYKLPGRGITRRIEYLGIQVNWQNETVEMAQQLKEFMSDAIVAMMAAAKYAEERIREMQHISGG